MKYIVGIDEVGRGPIAGPVTVCVFLMQADYDILQHFKDRKLRDSKKLTQGERKRIHTELKRAKVGGYVDLIVVSVSAEMIDKNGISLAIKSCIEEGLLRLLRLGHVLDQKNCQIELDGALKLHSDFLVRIQNKYQQKLEYRTAIKGDENIPAIACASILAKVARDRYMKTLGQKICDADGRWYNWASNAGYGTKEHYELIEKHGITSWHRKSFLSRFS